MLSRLLPSPVFCIKLFQEYGQFLFQNLVPPGIGMHHILHEFILRRSTICGKKRLSRIGKENVLSVMQFRQQSVRLLHRFRQVFLLPWENAQQQDFGRGALPAHQADKCPDIVRTCLRRILAVPQIIGPQQHNDDPRRNAVQLPVLDTVIGIIHIIKSKAHIRRCMRTE